MSKPADVAKLMREAQRLAGYGEVRLTLSPVSGFYAHAYPDRDTAIQSVVRRMQESGNPPTSVTVISEAMADAVMTPLAYAKGGTPADAVEALLAKLKTTGGNRQLETYASALKGEPT